MKKYLFLAASALALASCSSDDFIGTPGTQENGTSAAINFNSGTNNITRATKTGAEAASDLGNKFVVFGYKTINGTTNSNQTVYDHYNVNWLGLDTKVQTESNTAGWEYVGQEKNNTLNTTLGDQTIKYWDLSAAQYDFVAFAFGKSIQGTDVTANRVTIKSGKPTYTLAGTVEDLAKCFISDRVTAKKDVSKENKKANKLVAYRDNVQFNFRSLSSKVKMAIYEIIPGYSIKDVKYYVNSTESSPTGNAPTLFAESTTIPSGTGTMTVSFGSDDEDDTDFNQAQVSWTATGDNASKIEFGELSTVTKESKEANGNEFIGRNITEKSAPTEYNIVLPGTTVGALTLKVDYTLESIDGSGEEIKVIGATATVPAVYTNWQPNYAYTYIFKISDKTNGSTDPDDPDTPGLYPITFDAVVTETETGKQETITEVDKPSITAYAKGAVNEEYKVDQNIYVSVDNNAALYTENTIGETTTTKNCALYTVTATGYEITEANVALALSNGKNTLKEGSNTLEVTPSDILHSANEIAADDAVDGNAIKGNFAKFTPATAGTYVFEYIATDGKKYYKVIIVKD